MAAVPVTERLSGGPLTGVTVIELAAIGPAPFAAMMLADMGADVMRIDRPIDVANPDMYAGSHQILNRGRRSIAVDLKHPDGPSIVLDLIADAAVLIEGFRPGVAERLGLGPADALARNPKLVYGRMTGWGQDGPAAQRAGHDLNYIGLAGALEPIVGADSRPVAPLNMLGDFGGGGMLLAFGIVSALLQVERSGQGQVIDAAIVDGTALLTAMLHSMRGTGEWSAPRGENLFDGGAPFYQVYRASDGRWLAVAPLESQFYAQLVLGLELSAELALHQQWDRASWPHQRQLIAARIAERTRDEWLAVFDGTDACVTPVLSPSEAPADPHLSARGVLSEWAGLIQPAPAPRLSTTPGRWPGPAPKVGEHTRELLVGLKYSAARIAALVESGAVQAPTAH